MLAFLWILIVPSLNSPSPPCTCQNSENNTCLIDVACQLNISATNQNFGQNRDVNIQNITITICLQRLASKAQFQFNNLYIQNSTIKHDELCIPTRSPSLEINSSSIQLENMTFTFFGEISFNNTNDFKLTNSAINTSSLSIVSNTLELDNSSLKAQKQGKSECSCLINQQCLINNENKTIFSYVGLITEYVNLTKDFVTQQWQEKFSLAVFNLSQLSYFSILIATNNSFRLNNKSKIRGYYIGIYALNITNEQGSTINTDGSGQLTNEGYGCGYTDKIIGLRQQCGGTGGSHGGVGGISTSPKTNYNQLCLQLQSKQIYDYSFNPVLPGSGGGGVSYGQWPQQMEIQGQGGGVIYLESIYLSNDGIISSNGSSKVGQPFVGSGSGGSVQVRMMFLNGSGYVAAAGGGIGQQIDTNSYEFARQKFYQTYEVYGGFGGGGRIRLLFFNISEMLNSNFIANNTITANAGPMSQYQSSAVASSGQNPTKFQGSVVPTGCPQGSRGNFCNLCPLGTYKYLYGQSQCQPCLNLINDKTQYNQNGETIPFCDVGCITANKQPTDGLCQAGLWEFSEKLGGQNSIFAIFVIIILLLINIAIVWVSREKKQKKSRQYYGSYDDTTMQQMTSTLPEHNNKTYLISHDLLYHIKRVYLAGNNIYNDPWHIYPETAKDLDQQGNIELMNFFDKFNEQAKYATWEKVLLLIFKFYYYPLYLWILQLRQISKFKSLSKLFVRSENLFPNIDGEFHNSIKLKFSCSKDKTLAFLDKLDLSQKIIEQSDEIEFPLTLVLSGLGTFPYPFQINIHDALIKRLWQQFRNVMKEDSVNLFEKFVTEFNYYAVKIDFRQSQSSFIKRFSDLLQFMTQYNAEIFRENDHLIQVDLCIHLIGQTSYLYMLGTPGQRELEYLLSQIHTVQNFSYDFVVKVSIIFNHYNPESNKTLESYTNNVCNNINQQILLITGQEEDNVRNQLFQQKRQMQSKMNRDKFDAIKKYQKRGILVFKRGFTWLFSQITRYRDSRVNQQFLIAGICILLALQWCFVIAYPVILFIVYDNGKESDQYSVFEAEFITQLVVFPLAQIISLAILSAWLLKQRRNYGKMYLLFNLCGLASSLIEFIFGCYDLFNMNSSAEYNLFKLFPFFFILLSSHLVCLQMNYNELSKTKYFEI